MIGTRFPGAKHRTYTDADRASAILAVRANGGNILKTANQLGLDHQTLRYWVNGVAHPEATDIANAVQADMAKKLEEVAYKLIDSVPGKIEKASLKDVANALSIVIDKMRLLRGESTSAPGMSEEDRLLRLTEIMQKAQNRINSPDQQSQIGSTNGNGTTDEIIIVHDSGGTDRSVSADPECPADDVVPLSGTADNGDGKSS